MKSNRDLAHTVRNNYESRAHMNFFVNQSDRDVSVDLAVVRPVIKEKRRPGRLPRTILTTPSTPPIFRSRSFRWKRSESFDTDIIQNRF